MELLPLVCLCLLSCSGDAVKVFVREDGDAVLPCLISDKRNLAGKVFDWKKDESQKDVFMYDGSANANRAQDQQFKGRVSHFQDQLQNGNASIKITKTKMADSGNYKCIFPNLQPSQTFYIELVVAAASEPYVKTINTDDGMMLQCKVLGASPKPKVEWKDSSGNILEAEEPKVTERGGSYDIILRAAVTKTDTFSCVVTQEEFSHQISAEIDAAVTGAASKPYLTTINTGDGMMLQCEVLGASPKPKVELKDSSGNILPVKDLKETERGGSYDIILQTALTKMDKFSCVVTQEGIDQPISAEIDVVNGSSAGWIFGGVVSILLVVVAVPAGLYIKNRTKQNPMTDEEKREPRTEPNSSTSLKESS